MGLSGTRVDGFLIDDESALGSFGGTRYDAFLVEEAPYLGILKRWTGAAWVKTKIQARVGEAWVEPALKYYDGADWLDVDNTG